jgi:hypothetical protein
MNIIEWIYCGKYGHKPKERVRKIWREPNTTELLAEDSVVLKATQERSACGRCGKGLSEWKETGHISFQVASFPSHVWDRIREGKTVIC